jgi:hypothetical protein
MDEAVKGPSNRCEKAVKKVTVRHCYPARFHKQHEYSNLVLSFNINAGKQNGSVLFRVVVDSGLC